MVDLFDYQGKWEKLVDKAISSDYESLSANEKVWLNVQYLTDSIRNGGLISYYYNSPADTLEDCQKALDVLGVANMKYLIEQMNRLFPGGVPKDITARNQIINTWPEEDEKLETFLEEIEKVASAEAETVEAKLVEFIQQTGIGAD